jgi:hypothetical protein
MYERRRKEGSSALSMITSQSFGFVANHAIESLCDDVRYSAPRERRTFSKSALRVLSELASTKYTNPSGILFPC